MNGKFHKVLTLCLLSLALSPAVHAGAEVIIQFSSSSEAVAAGASPESPTFDLMELRIQDGWVEAEDEGVHVIFDRAGESLVSFNEDTDDYDVDALFALLEFRTSSYIMLSGKERFGFPSGSYGTGSPVVLADHLFGFINPDVTSEPELTETDRERRWYSGDVELASWTKRGTETSAEVLELFAFWIRQTSGGHPVITSDLVAQGRLPDMTKLIFFDGRVRKTVEIELVGVREIEDMTLDQRLAGLDRHTTGAGEDTFLALLDWIVSRSAFAESISNDGTADNTVARTAFENGDPIRGILESVRVEMVTGQSPDVELDLYQDSIEKSRTAGNLLRSLSASNPEAYAQAVQTLEVLSDAFEDQAGVFKLLIAQNLVLLDRFGMAERLYREVIMSEPSLAVAYKNYGDLLRATGRYPLGWLCYEAFEVIAPNHPSNLQIEELKTNLRETFVGFF